MHITSTELKQNTIDPVVLQREDIVITKREKPFAVIVDYTKYNQLVQQAKQNEINKKLSALESLGEYSLGGKNFKELKAGANLDG